MKLKAGPAVEAPTAPEGESATDATDAASDVPTTALKVLAYACRPHNSTTSEAGESWEPRQALLRCRNR